MNFRHLNRRDVRKDVSVCTYCVGRNAHWWEKPDYSVELEEVFGHDTEPRLTHEEPLARLPSSR